MLTVFWGIFSPPWDVLSANTIFQKWIGLNTIHFMTITCESEENMQPVFRISNWGRLDGPFCCL